MRYAICKTMGWDFYTYEAQPPFFIEQILIFMNQEANKQRDIERSARVKSKLNAPTIRR